jgi:hypothetical protein
MCPSRLSADNTPFPFAFYASITFWPVIRYFRKRPENLIPDVKINFYWEACPMGKGILLWLLGVPIPVIIILALLFRW